MMDAGIFKIYNTKHALTSGITIHEGMDCGGGMVSVGRGFGRYFLHGEGKDWHRSIESATERAEIMRKAKIESLRRQIKKLEGLTFEKAKEVDL